jgi:hypothetical protein
MKRSKKDQMRDDGLSGDVDHILRLFRAYEAATTSTTIRTAWRKAGFEYDRPAIGQAAKPTMGIDQSAHVSEETANYAQILWTKHCDSQISDLSGVLITLYGLKSFAASTLMENRHILSKTMIGFR